MELLYVLLVALPILLVVLLARVLNRLVKLSSEMDRMGERMSELGLQLERVMRGGTTSAAAETVRPIAPKAAPEPHVEALPAAEEPEPPTEAHVATPPPVKAVLPIPPKPTPRPEPVPVPTPEPQPSFFERHPDLERFIGENLINKIGIAVLVLGIGLLMQYAIGKGLISETGRTLIGLASGGVLVFFAHRLREGFRAFSSVLVAGGIVVFYFSIWIAFHEYKLIGQTAAFAIMVLITALAVLLTLAFDRKELAIISLIGGFATPFLVSTGAGDFRVLFTYLLILNAGMLVLAGFKKWHVINVLAFAFTVLLFGGWLLDRYQALEPRPWAVAWGFATAFFVTFFSMNLRYSLRHRSDLTPMDLGLLVANSAAYYGAGMLILDRVVPKLTGLFTVLAGLFHLVFAVYFHKRQGSPRILRLLLIGLVLTFISLAAPVQLEGSYITLFWAAECVLLLWFAQRTGLTLVERSAYLVLTLMVISLAMDLEHVYGRWNDVALTPLLNKGWTTGAAAMISLLLMHRLLARVPSTHEPLPQITVGMLGTLMAVAGFVVLYLVNFLEIGHQLGRVLDFPVVNLALMAWTLICLIGLDFFTRKAPAYQRRMVALLLVTVAVLQVFVGQPSTRAAISQLLDGSGGQGAIAFHYLVYALLVVALVRIAWLARALLSRSSSAWANYLWAMSIYLVILASQQLDVALLLGAWPSAGEQYASLAAMRRVGYPILWGCGSFLFMWYGMAQRLRTIRVFSLVLFALTLLKLFLVDLGRLSEGGRVASFILLGALLLVISFMYQRLKGLLKDDSTPDNGTPDQP